MNKTRPSFFPAVAGQLVSLLLFLALPVKADEGMWMLGNLDKETRREMKALGLQLPANRLYSERHASLKDAVVSFGGFCSGVVVSADGLVFTNHHCGFSSIQQHSSVGHDYLKDGFAAQTLEEELPNPDLYVRFLLRQEDVTKRVLSAVTPVMSESERSSAVDSVRYLIGEEVSRKDSTLVGVVDAYYGGNEFWLSVYRDYNDVRLVFAPPSSVGKFGWDTDNWEWPRHTGDFSVFRIYADRENRPAHYSPDNVPYRPSCVAPISTEGYREGSFCMTLGYPGTTERYLSSFGIEEMMYAGNQARIDLRGVKQAIWKRAMEQSDSIRIKYASKYDESSNYWKNSIGVNRAIRRLGVLEKKRAAEQELCRWIKQTPEERESLLHLFTDLELNYKARREETRAQAYFVESFLNGPELIQLALTILNLDFEGEERDVVPQLKAVLDQYADLDLDLDKEVFTALLGEYRDKVGDRFLPELYQTIDTLYGGDCRAYVDSLYAHSELTTPRGLGRFLSNDSTYNLFDDPAISVGIDLIMTYMDMNLRMQEATDGVTRGERLLNAAHRRMYASRRFYPDANSTLRLSFGTVCGYTPRDGVRYDYYTTPCGIFEKVKAHAGEPDFYVQPEILELLSQTENHSTSYLTTDYLTTNVCFLTNNDITGGNSGSAMFNARGQLMGLAFDGNWEAMSSDILYQPDTQRTIAVDVRYILLMIEKWGKATRLIQELDLQPLGGQENSQK